MTSYFKTSVGSLVPFKDIAFYSAKKGEVIFLGTDNYDAKISESEQATFAETYEAWLIAQEAATPTLGKQHEH